MIFDRGDKDSRCHLVQAPTTSVHALAHFSIYLIVVPLGDLGKFLLKHLECIATLCLHLGFGVEGVHAVQCTRENGGRKLI
jgi:hypothetical protein